jgi:hypothetical protein
MMQMLMEKRLRLGALVRVGSKPFYWNLPLYQLQWLVR